MKMLYFTQLCRVYLALENSRKWIVWTNNNNPGWLDHVSYLEDTYMAICDVEALLNIIYEVAYGAAPEWIP